MTRRYTPEEKRAILAIVDACEALEVGTILTQDVMRLVTGRNLLLKSWLENIRRWRKDPDLEWNPPEIVMQRVDDPLDQKVEDES